MYRFSVAVVLCRALRHPQSLTKTVFWPKKRFVIYRNESHSDLDRDCDHGSDDDLEWGGAH